MSQLNTEEQQVLYLIKTDADQARYFFARVKSLKWFNILKEQSYFCPENIPNDSEGRALFWNVLDYLERISEQVSQDLRYGKELIEIIESVVQYSLTKKRVDNYHIWWYCVKILNNLPASVIKENLTIEKFHTWLFVLTDHSMGVDLTISDIGEKLLPKFLNDEYGSEYKYAETIIDVITEIKAGGNLRGVTQREDAVLAWHSYWIRDAFKKHGHLIGQKCSLECIFGIANRLKSALEYKQKNYYANIEVGGSVYQIWVARQPKDGLKPGAINYENDRYECLVKQFSPDQLKNIDRENDFWALHNTEPQIEIIKPFSIAASDKETMTLAIIQNLPEGINWESDKKLQKKIENIFEGLHSDYSHIWFRSLAGGGHDHASGAEDILTKILHDVLLAKCETNRQDGKKVLGVFLSNEYQFPIFRRFVLLCVDKYWADYNEYLDKVIKVVPNILEESDLEVEAQDVLQHHNTEFSQELKTKLVELINKVPEYYIEKGDKLSDYWKFKWLSPLRENPDFKSLYEEAKRKVAPKDGKPYEPERTGFTKAGWVTHKSPISKDEILQKPIEELIKYLSEFKGTDFWHGTFEGEPDKEGLADVLQAAVKEDTRKFTDEMSILITVDYYYLHHIFRGLKDAWNTNKELDWNKVFDCCLKYLERGKEVILKDALQAQGEDSGKGRYIWIVEDIVELINDGSQNDAKTFSQEHFDKVEKIFDLILPLLKGEKQPDTQRDALTYALNTTLGKTIMAYVSFSLRVAKATQKKLTNWGRDRYERFLPIGIDGYIWFGCYLPRMAYLDKDYTAEKINFFAQKDSSNFEWQMFMEGYLTGSPIYQDLYGLMRPNYLKAIENTVFKGHANERLVEHICIGYLQLVELLAPNNKDGQPSLFWKMLDGADTADKRSWWEEVAGFFWSISGRKLKKEERDEKEEPSEDSKKKVLAFWEWTVKERELVKSKLGDEYNVFLSRMAELTIWLDKIDENTEKWLMLCAPYIELEHRSAFFIEYLTKFDDEESVRRIGKIFTKVLETATPTFKQEEVQLIVERLYKIGEKDPMIKVDADNICNTYGRRGLHFLKDIWAKYNKINEK